MMERFELRFWDVVTPMLTVMQSHVCRMRRPALHKLAHLQALIAGLSLDDQRSLLRAALFSGVCGFLTGTICYLALFASVRF